MSLLRLENITLAFGEIPILDHINLKVEPKEKIFLVGRNGMGKSCLFKVIMGQMKVDDGIIFKEPGIRIAELQQELPNNLDVTVFEFVAQGLAQVGALLKEYHDLTTNPSTDHDRWLKELAEVQRKLEVQNGWQLQQSIETVLSKLDLQADQKLQQLSGGWKRRAALAKALASQPDLLLLDEPTNHLDLDAIQWLEEYLLQYKGALICITHDRAFLRRLSQRIIELDRGHLYSYNGNFNDFLQDKQHRLEVESTQSKLFDKVLAKEEAWIRQGIKARRTRNEGRVRALEQLRRERSQRRNLQGDPKFTSNIQSMSGELVIEADKISYSINDLNLVKTFSVRIYRGDKIALIGPNGIGKTTLLKLLLGQLQPISGKIKLGTNLHLGYFDQLRAGIDYEQSAIDNVAGGRDSISINGKSKHIISYLADFLFTPDRMRIPVKMLSGGECNRLLLAKMFSLPNNLLVLDEPTNDLDIESLELLEEILSEYPGTILLVSHDREFVDQVATSTLFFRGNGIIEENVGGYKDIPLRANNIVTAKTNIVAKVSPKVVNDTKQLNQITNKITNLEAKQHKLHLEMAEEGFYNKDATTVQAAIDTLAKIDQELSQLYERWQELES
jgi:ATP-binding cassette subfamily F protein uup